MAWGGGVGRIPVVADAEVERKAVVEGLGVVGKRFGVTGRMRLTGQGCSVVVGLDRQGNGGDGVVCWSSSMVDGSVRCSWLWWCSWRQRLGAVCGRWRLAPVASSRWLEDGAPAWCRCRCIGMAAQGHVTQQLTVAALRGQGTVMGSTKRGT
jgi:hypothetical protein